MLNYNETIYCRARHDNKNKYKKISMKLLNDKRLTVLDKGVLISLLSNADNYIINITNEQKTSGIGYDLYSRAIKNLIRHGFLIMERKKGRVIWTIIEEGSWFPTTKESTVSVND